MPLTISLPPDTESRLRERARAVGQDIEQFVERLIASELAAPMSLSAAAEPIARAVDAAGASEDEFTAAIVQALEGSRRDRKRKPA
jgi:hypothetical protein